MTDFERNMADVDSDIAVAKVALGIAIEAKDLKAITACTERLSTLEKAKQGRTSSDFHLSFTLDFVLVLL